MLFYAGLLPASVLHLPLLPIPAQKNSSDLRESNTVGAGTGWPRAHPCLPMAMLLVISATLLDRAKTVKYIFNYTHYKNISERLVQS